MFAVIFSVLWASPILALGTNTEKGADICFWFSEKVECENNEFRCLNGEKCIKRESYCNSRNDCGDNSDERYCNMDSCPEGFSTCESYTYYRGKCIPDEWKCNGHNDCPYPSRDEQNCRTAAQSRPKQEPITRQSWLAVSKAMKWVHNQKNNLSSSGKWGYNADKMASILYHGARIFNASEQDESEMVYEMNIQLLSRLSSMKLEEMESTELASAVNSFLLTGIINPRKFHGFNLVEELRNRADQESYTNPYVYLALCNAGERITESDQQKIINTFESKHRKFWTDMQAVAVMALACASKQPGNEVDTKKLQEMSVEMKQQQYRNGTVINLATTALVMQALIATSSESDPDNFDEKKAFNEIMRNQKSDGSFGDVMNTFLVMPVLKCKSLVDINLDHGESGDEVAEVENLPRRGNEDGPTKRVQYSLWIGNEKNLERNLVLMVPQNASLYEVIEVATEFDSRFKFEYSMKNRKPYISAISGMRDDPLTGKFWFLYTFDNGEPTLSDASPADIVPDDNGRYVMWYRKGTWVDGSA